MALTTPLASVSWGTVQLEADDDLLSSPEHVPLQGLPTRRVVWLPPDDVDNQLPSGFRLSMRCVDCPDGIRRFYPLEGWDRFVPAAFAGGLALLDRQYDLGPEGRSSYRLMYHFYRWARGRREHLGNGMYEAGSFGLSRLARDGIGEQNILPDLLGLNPSGDGRPWGLRRLIKEGRHEAQRTGVVSVNERDAVHYGFVAAARLNPLSIRPGEVLPLIRSVLYDADALGAPPDPALLDQVAERAAQALARHLDAPAKAFDRWFSGPRSSLVHQIAQRKKAVGGQLSPEGVRGALLELGWQGYRYLSLCIAMQMTALRKLLPVPLSPVEQAWYDGVYLPQPVWGGLPFVLLAERFSFLRSVLWQLWQTPGDPEVVAVVHRLLDYYAQMAVARRAADRRIKARQAGVTGTQRAPLTVEFPMVVMDDDVMPGEAAIESRDRPWGEPLLSVGPGVNERFVAVADAIRTAFRVQCNCLAPDWIDAVEGQTGTSVHMVHRCGRCGLLTRTACPLERLRKLVL